MSIRKVVTGLLITAGIAIMAVPFFWRTTGEKQTEHDRRVNNMSIRKVVARSEEHTSELQSR